MSQSWSCVLYREWNSQLFMLTEWFTAKPIIFLFSLVPMLGTDHITSFHLVCDHSGSEYSVQLSTVSRLAHSGCQAQWLDLVHLCLWPQCVRVHWLKWLWKTGLSSSKLSVIDNWSQDDNKHYICIFVALTSYFQFASEVVNNFLIKLHCIRLTDVSNKILHYINSDLTYQIKERCSSWVSFAQGEAHRRKKSFAQSKGHGRKKQHLLPASASITTLYSINSNICLYLPQ